MKTFFDELKRRNVVRVGIAYVIVGWVIAQVVDLAADNFNAPDWVPQMTMIGLLIGLPIVLLFSWAYEVTPEGVKKTKEVDQSKSVTHGTGQRINKLIAGALVLALGFIVYDKMIATDEPVVGDVEAGQVTIAVLPFTDLSPEGDQEYFADGISEEILNVLAKTKGLLVASRTSSFQFKGGSPDIQDIANQLGVETILEGSIRKDGNTLRITAQLINARDGFHIWSETYDRELTSIFAIQDEISRNIATSLLGTLGIEALPEKRFASTGNAEAYTLYLRGNFLRNDREAESLLFSIGVYEQALKLDPDFADAWAGLGKAYLLIAAFGGMEENFARRKGLEAANTALNLNPDNGLAYAVLGLGAIQNFNLKDAKSYLEKALQLRPKDSEVHFWNGIYHSSLGEFQTAISFYEKGYELDPFISTQTDWLLSDYLALGQKEKARAFIEELRAKGLDREIIPGIINAEIMFSLWENDFEGALAAVPEGTPFTSYFKYRVLLMGGFEEQSAELRAELSENLAGGENPAAAFFGYSALGEFEKTAEALDSFSGLSTIVLREIMYMISPDVDPTFRQYETDFSPILLFRPDIVKGYNDIGIDILKETGLDE